MLERYFGLNAHGTNVRTEMLAGVTTFLSMAYITVVNPAILSDAGMDFGAVFVATCIAAAVGSVIMGVWANYPIAQAPGMGQNAFFTYGVVLGLGHTWEAALGAVLVSGVIFVVLSVLPVREWLINAIPKNLKLGISAGIGLFLGFIAMKNAGIVVDNPATLVSFGDFSETAPLICLGAFALIAALSARGITGAVIIGMLVATLLGLLLGDAEYKGLISTPPSLEPVLFKFDLMAVLDVSMVTVIVTMLLVDVFDTAGTLVGVANRAGLTDDEGKLPRLGKALLSDSTATVVGAVAGTSSTTSYIESAAGLESGGRTGLVAVTVAGMFLLCIFLAPLAQTIPAYATAAALLFVACIMAQSLADLDWEDLTESAPAIVCALGMPLSFSIADGIGMGFITYVAIKLMSGKAAECPVAVYVVAAIFLGKFLLL
ncbi:MAG: NCS2 family permease [Pseudomonadales bacterium]|nr:NCS2 family permease [Pseudomonadales bacterium]MBO6564282.1 NCS2 family permease [Pseudomonadales bacterium]MBO6595105.1 NCS2 family permease [Pseudomonadales bacterium]MBO6657133.1 NCS2 family permease [Pseudomonadales bacterium]MBO6701610.1 NCS2 family permease [Pseudomonadales bacterium]